MKLYFLRHGRADWPNWDKPDAERPLDTVGKKDTRRVAAALAARGVKTDVILSSPLPRAQQTAEITAAAFGLTVSTEPGMAPGFNSEALHALLQKYGGQNVMLVGHEPDFSRLIEDLTGGIVVMAKAGVARVDLANADDLHGELRWLMPPKMLR
jgi:phosphohistidine phosphatase